MKISRLKFKANLTRNPTDIKNYKTQRDVAVKLNCQSILENFEEVSYCKRVTQISYLLKEKKF